MEDPDDIIEWQLSEMLRRRTPTTYRPVAKCPHCPAEFHGLPHPDCGGSHLTKDEAQAQAGRHDWDTPTGDKPTWL